ncbi:hypothetical protein A5906_30815 [Bradyrhizobium sacchari]|nr:hypothetical protein A5906_30815 [Bradyrhizobium sacchari]
MTCEAVSILQWVAGGFAVASAALWVAASLFKTPPPAVTFQSIDEIAAALTRQGRYNAGAAIAAAVAAGIQGVLLLAPTCIHPS